MSETPPYARRPAGTGWFKSSASESANGCVEVRHADEGTYVRDSKDPRGSHLFFTPREWECFLSGAVDGEFHRL